MADIIKVENKKCKQITPKQRKAIQLLVYEGYSQAQACKEVGVNKTSMSKWMNHNERFIEAFNKELHVAQSYRTRAYKCYAQQAIATIVNLAKSADNETVRLNAAKEILDRAGDKPVDKVEYNGDLAIHNPFADVSTEDLKKALQDDSR